MNRSITYIIVAILLSMAIIIYLTSGKDDSPYFSFTDQHGEAFTSNKFKDKITIFDFFFTTCKGPCPVMNIKMKSIVETYPNNEEIQFVSISVDPQKDTEVIINQYIKDSNLAYDNWYFLQTKEPSLSKLLESMYLSSGINLPHAHSTKFFLVDRDGNSVAKFDPFIEDELNQLNKKIQKYLKEI